MNRNENKQQKKQQKQERRTPGAPGKKRDRELELVTYLFVGLFTLLIGYFAYFETVLSPEVINNPYNARQDAFADRVVRGQILSSDGTVLAKTQVLEDGSEKRDYPFGPVFSHVVGYSDQGKTGIEGLANFYLLTSDTFFGEKIANEIKEEKNIGDNVVTTLDANLQQTAYDALGKHRGAVVVLESGTGRVLSMVSKPDFDPNRIAADWERLTSGAESESVLYNRASQGLYPPGSTFKIVTLLEYMRENPGYAAFSFDCKSKVTEGNYTINCYGKKAHGEEDLKKAFAKSCNTAFASIGLTLDETMWSDTCKSLLFGTDLPVELVSKKSSFVLKPHSTPAERMMAAIGQGETVVTPLHMALLASSIANDGVLMKPYFLDRVENYTGDSVKTFRPEQAGTLMTPEEAAVLTEYMNAVVTDGTGSKLADLGFPVAGKTGTAEYSSNKNKSHAWFVGFSETGDRDITVCVLVEEAGSGSEYAVPIARKIFVAWGAEE